jgi:FKBP-type peptidyl-prolyl cis-trans isomerase
MTCTVKVLDVMKDEETFRTFQMDVAKKREAKQKIKDEKAITDYLAEKKIDAKTDTSGIHYVIHNNSGGQKPTPESCVTVKYSGKFMKDGMEFDKNDKISFSLTQVIPGWRISIPMIGVGDSATFYIPSGLAYGPKGYPGAIPPDAILIFNVHLLGVGAGYDQATQSCK